MCRAAPGLTAIFRALEKKTIFQGSLVFSPVVVYVSFLFSTTAFKEFFMGLQEDITAAVKDAMRKKEKLRLGVLRMLTAEIKNRRIENQRELKDEDILQVITRMVKQRNDSAEQFASGNREELAAKERAEIEVLKTYLPEALDTAELERLVKEAITEAQAESKKDMGKVMKVVMPKIAGRADGKAVNQMVARLLG